MRNVLTLLIVAVNFWMPCSFAGDASSLGNFPGYSKPLSGDDTEIRTAVVECRAYVSKRDLKMKDRELEFNGCVGRRGIPLIFFSSKSF
ncbi:hypothetical protein ABIB99_004974 [Bradyrhizobium sp. LA6.1]|uniref:hypothetical protein n=1 Tax=Bradyrhizobium sp. LA6.1 TaxID=3156378 RepID=UPI003398DA0D